MLAPIGLGPTRYRGVQARGEAQPGVAKQQGRVHALFLMTRPCSADELARHRSTNCAVATRLSSDEVDRWHRREDAESAAVDPADHPLVRDRALRTYLEHEDALPVAGPALLEELRRLRHQVTELDGLADGLQAQPGVFD